MESRRLILDILVELRVAGSAHFTWPILLHDRFKFTALFPRIWPLVQMTEKTSKLLHASACDGVIECLMSSRQPYPFQENMSIQSLYLLFKLQPRDLKSHAWLGLSECERRKPILPASRVDVCLGSRYVRLSRP